MMKIQTTESDAEVVIRVEGRLAGVFVPELESSWKAARAAHPQGQISIDLKNVTCVDRSGRSLLHVLYRSGVHFLKPGLALQDILEEIRSPDC